MGRVARSERTKSQLRAERRGLRRARQVTVRPVSKPTLKRKFNAPKKTTRTPRRALPKLPVPTAKQQLRAPKFKPLREKAARRDLKRTADRTLLELEAKPLPKRYKYVAAPKPKQLRVSPRRVGTDVPKRFETKPSKAAQRDKAKLDREANRNLRTLLKAAYGTGSTRKGRQARQRLIDSGYLAGQTSVARREAEKRAKNARPKRVYKGDEWLKRAAKDAKGALDDPKIQQSVGKAMAMIAGGSTQVRPGKGRTLAAVQSPNVRLDGKQTQELGRVGANFIKDAVDLPAQAVPSAYYTGKPVVEALSEARKGRLDRAGKKVGEAAKLVYQPYKDLAEQPGKTFKDHPLATLLMLYGAGRVPGLAAGKALRVSPSKKLRTAGSITKDYKGNVRPPATLVTKSGGGAKMEVPRYYSKDAVVKAFQVARDKRREKRGETVTMKESQIKRRATATNSAGGGVSRVNRSAVLRESKKAVGKDPDAAIVLAVQRAIVDGGDGDLLGELKTIRNEYAAIKHEDPVKAARRDENLALLDKAIKNYDEERVQKATKNYIPLSVRLQDDLVKTGLLDADQAQKARLMSYAVRYMGAKFDGNSLVRAGAGERRALSAIDKDIAVAKRQIKEGNDEIKARAETNLARLEVERKDYLDDTLTIDEIRAHMAKRNPNLTDAELDAAFITHDPNMGGKNMMYASASASPIIRSKRRTGAAISEGLASLDPDTLGENLVRAQQLRDAAKNWARHVAEAAYNYAGGKRATFKDWRGAQQEVARLRQAGEGEWVAVRQYPIGTKKNQMEAHARMVDEAFNTTDAEFDKIVEQRFEEAFDGMDKAPRAQDGPWVLMPRAYANELKAHTTGGGAGPKSPGARAFGNIFRPIVLATSTKWMFGNIAEATLRAAFAHAGLRSWVTGRKLIKRIEELDPEQAQLYVEEVTGGGNYGMDSRVGVHVRAEDFEGTSLQGFARVIHKLGNAPGVKRVPQAWRAYTKFVMNTVNRSIERQFQTAMAGKRVRETLMDDELFKLSNKAIEQAAEGVMDRNTMVALGKSVDRMYGRYSKFSPTERAWVSTYTPFAAWALNAANFVLRVLPADHPVAVSVMASMFVASEEWRKDQGLSYFIEGALPGWLQGSIPGDDGSHLQLARYTPFGAFTGETAIVGTITGTLLPQFMTFYEAGKGRKWTGQELDGEGPGPALLEMSVALLGQTVPFFGPIKNIVSSDEKTVLGKIRKQTDPFRYTPNKSKGAPVLEGTGGKGGPPALPPPPETGGPNFNYIPPPPQ